MNFREKAKQVVADRYLSSPEGVREVQKMQEYFERENATQDPLIDIGIQIMNLLPDSSKPESLHNSLWMRARYIAQHLTDLFDLTSEQKDSLAAAIEKWTKSDTMADLPF